VLQEIAGEKVISEFKDKDPLSYFDLVRDVFHLSNYAVNCWCEELDH
jgi:hypothetical protein